MKYVWSFIKHWFPITQWCVQCNQLCLNPSIRNFCDSCARSIPFWEEEQCTLCLGWHLICPFNSKWKIEKAFSIFSYEEPVSWLMSGFKYQRNWIYGKILVEATLIQIRMNQIPIFDFDFIIPIPTTKKKIYQRGFNPTVWLARSIFPPEKILLGKRFKSSKDQAKLKRKERLQNLQGRVFQLDSKKIKNKKVLIFDDVMTTGTTMKKMTREAYRCEAKSVSILCLARNV